MSEEVDLGIPGIGPATLVGRGGFGRVYRAVQSSLGGVVAVKVVAGHLDATGRARFEREARALGALRGHPNICTVYDAGVDAEDRPYLVMEYAPTTLAQRLADGGAMPSEDAAALVTKVASALQQAHSRGLLHRDVKPENVLIDEHGTPKLADFGLARFADDTMSRGITTTVSHAAPELLREEPPTVASDVYALGSTLFAALTGHVAFAQTGGAHPGSVYRRIEEDPVPDTPGVPEPVAAVVRKAMAKQPGDRFASAEAFGDALDEARRSSGPAVAAPPLADGERPPPRGEDAEETVDNATPHHPELGGGLTEAVVRGNRGPVVIEDVDGETDSSGKRRDWRLVAAAAVFGVAVIGGAFALLGTGGDGDGGNDGAGTEVTTPTSEPTTTTSEPMTAAERIDANWSLASANFSESTFCDLDSCLPLDSLSFTVDCTDFDIDELCTINADEIGIGYVAPGSAGADSWTAHISDGQGFAQLICEGGAATTAVDMELEATGEEPVDGSAVTLEGIYRTTVDDDGACSGEYVAYDIVMGR